VTKEMYTFTDKAKRSITLRPEYTPSVVRAIIEHRLYLQPDPMRYYFIGPMFRYDKPQKGRYRQFYQIDVEVFGERDSAIDAEIVEMADSFLQKLNIEERELLVNSVGCRKCRISYHRELKKAAKMAVAFLCPDCQRKTEVNPLRIFDCKVETCREQALKFPKITDFLCSECRIHFETFCSFLDLYGIPYRVDPMLVRGLDYYTKTTFEIVSSRLGAQDSILGGGRYDDMVKDFGGPDLCGIGFAIGLDRLLSVIPDRRETGRLLYIVHVGEEAKKQGMFLTRYFHRQGIECLIEYKERSLKNQMARASKLGAKWVLIIGEDEIRSGKYQLKDMETGVQVKKEIGDLIKNMT